MAILVTGGAGYIGSHVVRHLSERGEKVVVFDNLSTGYRESLLHGEEFVKGDVRDPEALKRVFERFDIESVLHFAAVLVVPDSVRDPLKYYAINTGGLINLLSASKGSRLKNIIFSSTSVIYGPPYTGALREDGHLEPQNPYGSSKMLSEKVLGDYSAQSGLNSMVLRYFNVAGADPKGRIGQRSHKATHLIKVACEAAAGKREGMDVYGTDYPTPDGTCIRDYVHVEDIASAHLLALDSLRGRRGHTAHRPLPIFNVGYGRGCSVLEVIEAVKKVTGKKFEVRLSDRREGDPPMLVSDNSKIINQLGWKPQHASVEQIITDAYRWEKSLP